MNKNTLLNQNYICPIGADGVQAVAWWLTFPGVQAWWQARPIPFTESFTAFMESMLKDNPTDAEQTQRYQEFIAQEKSQI